MSWLKQISTYTAPNTNLQSGTTTERKAESGQTSGANLNSNVSRTSQKSEVKGIDGVLNALEPTAAEKTAANNNSVGDKKSEGVSKNGAADEAQARALLTEGKAKMQEASSQGEECKTQTEQTKNDMAVAQQQQQSAVKETQSVKTSLTTLQQRKDSLLREVKTTSDEIAKEEEKLKKKSKKSSNFNKKLSL